MTLQQIVEAGLRAGGFDGLCRGDCGCRLDDLMPCNEPGIDCVAGHIRYGTFDGVDQDWIIASGVAPRAAGRERNSSRHGNQHEENAKGGEE